MFCPNCGTKLDDDAVFCGNCGARVVEDTPVQTVASPVSGQQTMQVQPTAPVQKEPKKPLPKGLLAGIAAAVVVLIALVVMFNVGKSAADYKKVVKKYVAAKMAGNFEQAYVLLHVPDSEFLSGEAFRMVNEEHAKNVDITNVKAEDITEERARYTTVVDGNKVIKVTYSYASSSSNSEYITVDKTGKKKFLFFDEYKVSTDELVATQTVVRTPANVKASVNGVEIKESYKSDAKSTAKVNYYVLPYTFSGDNRVKVTGDYVEDFEDTTYISGEGGSYSVSTSKLSFKKDLLDKAKEQAKADVEKVAAAAVANKNFKEIGLQTFATAESVLESSYQRYSLDDCHSSYRDVTVLNLTDIKPAVSNEKINTDSDDGVPYIEVKVQYNATGKYTEKYTYKESTEKDGKANGLSATMRYKYADGSWKLARMNVDLYIR